jgi:hypothetical protein
LFFSGEAHRLGAVKVFTGMLCEENRLQLILFERKRIMKRNIFVLSVLIVAVVCASTAFAVGPLGPPTAELKQGQFGVAVEYGYSDSEIEVSGSGVDDTIKDFKSNAFIGQPGYGVTDDIEIYGLVGAADARFDGFDDGYDIVYGFGTKVTFLKQTDCSWGAMFEMDWREAEDSGVDIDFYEMTIAVGPTIKITDNFRVYGGPFFYILNGDADVETSGGVPVPEDNGGIETETGSGNGFSVKAAEIGTLALSDLSSGDYDLEEESSLGGFVGCVLDLNTNTSWYNEFQFTGDSWAFGTGIGWKF